MERATRSAFIAAKDAPWEAAGEGIQRQILGYDDGLMLVRVRFQKGAIGVLHSHPNRQVTYVESGAFEVSINGEKRLLRAGDSFFVDPDLEHGSVAREAGTLLDVFAPARADFLTNGGHRTSA